MGVFSNEFVGARILSDDGRIETTSWRIALWVLSLAFCGWGVVSLVAYRQHFALKLNLLFLTGTILSPLGAEGLLRVGIALRAPLATSPGLYFHEHQDEYWVSYLLWNDDDVPKSRLQGHVARAAQCFHPLFGWSQTEYETANPLGLRQATLSALDSPRRKVLFYGDSFVRSIPDAMQTALPETSIVHLGVGGFGTDQIYLMFRETIDLAADPAAVVVGILLQDLGRSLTRVRIAQKPYFVVGEHGELALQGVPIRATQREFLEQNAPRVVSYFGRVISNRLDLGGDAERRRARSRKLNGALLDRLQNTCRERQLPLFFVVFYSRNGLELECWEERFLKGELERRGLHYIDTKPALLEISRDAGGNIPALFDSDGHHTDETDVFLAELIVAAIRGELDR